jgi:hypothetical protein
MVATQIFTLGTMHIYLWQAPERADDANNRVRHAGCVPMPDPLIDPFKKRFGIDTLDQGYGQSEVLGMLHRYDTPPRKPGSLGQPLPGIEVSLLGDDDRPVAAGEVGEFCVRPTEPNTIFSGYWKNPEPPSLRGATSGTTPAISAGATRTATGSSSIARRTTSGTRAATCRRSRSSARSRATPRSPRPRRSASPIRTCRAKPS